MKKTILLCVLFLIVSSGVASAYSWGRVQRDPKREMPVDKCFRKDKYFKEDGCRRMPSKTQFGNFYSSRRNPRWKEGYVSPNYKNRVYGHRWTPKKTTFGWYRGIKDREKIKCWKDDWQIRCKK